MGSFWSEAIEQLKGQSKKKPPPPPTTGGLKELSPGQVLAEALRQTLGTPLSASELEARKEADQKEVGKQIAEQKAILAKQMSQAKGNTAVLSSPKPPETTPPPYITGKPGYQPEKAEEKEKKVAEQKKAKLPPLVEPASRPKRGSWLFSFKRKKDPEIKLGPSG